LFSLNGSVNQNSKQHYKRSGSVNRDIKEVARQINPLELASEGVALWKLFHFYFLPFFSFSVSSWFSLYRAPYFTIESTITKHEHASAIIIATIVPVSSIICVLSFMGKAGLSRIGSSALLALCTS
jgi:hypothetical protein